MVPSFSASSALAKQRENDGDEIICCLCIWLKMEDGLRHIPMIPSAYWKLYEYIWFEEEKDFEFKFYYIHIAIIWTKQK